MSPALALALLASAAPATRLPAGVGSGAPSSAPASQSRAGGGDVPPPEAVAIVSALSGSASVGRCRPRAALQRFTRLDEGCVVEVEEGSAVTLAVVEGCRYKLSGKARAVVSRSQVTLLSGQMETLEPVPPMPRLRLPPGSPTTAIGVRLRERTDDSGLSLYPDGAAALADATTLSFTGVPGTKRYRVELRDRAQRTLLSALPLLPSLAVPAGILAPDARYCWTIRTEERVGPPLEGRACFRTLSAEDAARRTALARALVAEGTAESLALLAGIDGALGLLREARDGFRAALVLSPADDGLRLTLEAVEKSLGESGSE